MAFERLRWKSGGGAAAEQQAEPDLSLLLPASATLEERLAQLFELLREPLYYYLLVVLGDAGEAEDLTQDAFLQLHKTMRGGQHVQQPRFWLFRVAHNLALNRLRQRNQRAPAHTQTWEELAQRLPDPAPNPEQAALAREEFQRLHAALAFLSPQEQQCLHLRVEGFRYREIAEILGLAIPSVAEFVRRAIRKLSKNT